MAENTAFVAAPLIVFDSHRELQNAVNLLTADPDFSSVRVFNNAGRLLASAATKVPDRAMTAARRDRRFGVSMMTPL